MPVSVLIFLFQNLTVVKNKQTIQLRAFGPSPQSADGRTLFAYNETKGRLKKETMWKTMRKNFDAIYVHTLLLANQEGVYNGTPSTDAMSQIALNSNELSGLRRLQKTLGFKVIVDTGLGLGVGCSSERRRWKFAEDAANRDYKFLKRLHDHGIVIDQVSVDGPFLRVVEGSEKAFSCASESKGFTVPQSAEIVSSYLGRLYRKIRSAQGVSPKMNLVLNYPNYQVEGLHGFFDVDLEDVLEAFVDREEYPELHEIVLDYPYSFVKDHQQLFKDKVEALSDLLPHFRGKTAPKLGVIVNTGAHLDVSVNHNTMSLDDYADLGKVQGFKHGKQCLIQGNQAPYLTIYKDNACFTTAPAWKRRIAEKYISAEERRYIRESASYYRFIKNELPSGVEVNSVYFASWYAFPKSMVSYGLKSGNIIKQLGK